MWLCRLLVVSALTLVLVWSNTTYVSKSYWDIELSPDSVAGVRYGQSVLSVFEHANQPGRFYVMPLVYLQHQSARTRYNTLTRGYELTFDILLWSREAQEAVHRYLKDQYNSSVTLENVQMLHMEMVRLTWKNSNMRPIAEEFKLVDQWVATTNLPSLVSFQFVCASEAACEELRIAMLEKPDIFDGFELLYLINSQSSAERSITVTNRHVLKGNLGSRLEKMDGTEDGTRYMNVNDMKVLVEESVRNVLASVVTDSDYVDNGDEMKLEDILEHILTKEKTSTANFQPERWKSVYWDPLWARPDMLSSFFNEALTKDETDSRYFKVNENVYSKAKSWKLGFGKFSVGTGSNSGGGSRILIDDVRKTLQERHFQIRWNGQMFLPKDMDLYLLNINTLLLSDEIFTSNVQLHKFEALHAIKVRLPSNETQTPHLTPDLVQSRLTAKLKVTNTQLKAELKHLRDQLTALETALNDAISTTKKDTEAKIAPMQKKLDTLPGWPTDGFCILAYGACPTGFTRSSGHMKAINLYTYTAPYITPSKFGDSQIKCHGYCGQWPPYTGELIIVACCKKKQSKLID